MLDIKYLKENLAEVKKALSKKHTKFNLEKVIALYDKKQVLLQKVEKLRARQNQFSRAGNPSRQRRAEAGKIKNEIKNQELKYKKADEQYKIEAILLHNIPDKSVPKKEQGNKIEKKWGRPRKFDFKIKDHEQLGRDLDIIDAERAAKVSGARFGYLKNEAVQLQFVLINYLFEKLTKKGFVLILPPVLVKERAMFGTGFFPTEKVEYYKTESDDMYLAGTAEVPLCAYHRDEILDGADLPKKYAGFSTCFRREAGTYGKDTKGIFRLHQFDKVEMFVFCQPQDSWKIFDQLVKINEEIFQELKLPYQLVNISGGELGAPNAKKIDAEVWFPSQKKYRELTSCSNDTDFQARRLNIKYRTTNNKQQTTNFVHTVNDTALAMGRTIAAIIENHQQEDGSIRVPKVLQKYFRAKIIKKG